MSKRPTRPRYYPSRKGYYAQINGKKIPLAKGEEAPEVLARAWEKFREMVPERERKVVGITAEEIEKINNFTGDLGGVIKVLWTTGCRPSEACTLAAEHLDREKRTVQIGSRMVPIDEDCFTWLVRLAEGVRSSPLLRNHNLDWTVDSLHGAFCRMRDRLGLRKDLTPYSIRHGYALKFLQDGGSITDLAAKLGISEKQARRLYRPGTSDDPKLKGIGQPGRIVIDGDREGPKLPAHRDRS
jgi:integrase